MVSSFTRTESYSTLFHGATLALEVRSNNSASSVIAFSSPIPPLATASRSISTRFASTRFANSAASDTCPWACKSRTAFIGSGDWPRLDSPTAFTASCTAQLFSALITCRFTSFSPTSARTSDMIHSLSFGSNASALLMSTWANAVVGAVASFSNAARNRASSSGGSITSRSDLLFTAQKTSNKHQLRPRQFPLPPNLPDAILSHGSMNMAKRLHASTISPRRGTSSSLPLI
mmetsp:Transcript_26235/g.69917  ORF Transcript_26235/g.69917 Transcript_26235/m.69917 type:complete len:232 (+) Transcript_26235:778-1473(+)